jgi:chloramphenicol-sensitive protein RarD
VSAKPSDEAQPRAGEGLAYALGAYLLWGLVPIYWRAVGPVPAVEVLAHRIAWSVVFVALLVGVSRGWGRVRDALGRTTTLGALALSTLLVTTNWGLFIWAVQTGRLVQASLGYYINPLANVLLGVVLLGERLRRPQKIAVGLAFAGVAYFALARGVLPWVSLALAASFGLYGLVRKRAPVEPIVGLFVETLLVAPLAIGYLVWLALQGRAELGVFGRGAFGHALGSSLLLVAAGPVTAIPLVWFAAAAKRLPLSTLGFVQYLSPSLQLLLAVLLFHESLTRAHLVTFGCIWSALALYSFDGLRQARASRRARSVTARS